MPLLYVNYKDNRKNGTGLVYGRAYHPSTVNLDAIAEHIQHNCSMTKGDCLNVLTEMVSVMTSELQNSNKVCIDGLGTFYLAVSTHGAVSEEVFDMNKCLKGVKVNFLAQGKKSNGVLTRTFTDSVKLKKLDLSSDSDSGSGSGSGSSTSGTGSNTSDTGQAGE